MRTKRTYKRIDDSLEQETFDFDDGTQQIFLNGVLQTMTKGQRFLPARSPGNGDHLLIIEDYAWWHVNHYDITEWMQENLPRGEHHATGMVLTFDNEEQRTWFMLRWS